MDIEDNNWAKMSRVPKQSARGMILAALESSESGIEGRPASPSIPLVGSMNVHISRKEEKECE